MKPEGHQSYYKKNLQTNHLLLWAKFIYVTASGKNIYGTYHMNIKTCQYRICRKFQAFVAININKNPSSVRVFWLSLLADGDSKNNRNVSNITRIYTVPSS
jgi:hypothetical protein